MILIPILQHIKMCWIRISSPCKGPVSNFHIFVRFLLNALWHTMDYKDWTKKVLWKLLQLLLYSLFYGDCHDAFFCVCLLVWWRLWNFIVRQVNFNTFLHPYEPPDRIFLYLVRQFEAVLSKIWLSVFKINFLVQKSTSWKQILY